jgi:hypothetical protein
MAPWPGLARVTLVAARRTSGTAAATATETPDEAHGGEVAEVVADVANGRRVEVVAGDEVGDGLGLVGDVLVDFGDTEVVGAAGDDGGLLAGHDGGQQAGLA